MVNKTMAYGADEVEQRAEAAAQAFRHFVKTIAALRHPQSGCPWDLEQDHASLRKYMLEEAYEAAAALVGDDDAHMCEELGDVLLQVVLNAQLASDRQAFAIGDVIHGIDAKMRRRHPHVFGEGGQQTSIPDVKRNWEQIKAEEKKGKGKENHAPSFFAPAEGVLPATTQAVKIGKLAAKINFDWAQASQVLTQLRSEIDELTHELAKNPRNPQALEAEIGDVYFSLAQLCRHLDVDAESAALAGNMKFMRRFQKLENLAQQRGMDVTKASQDSLEALWQEAKKQESPSA